MENNLFLWLFAALGYLLCGLLYSLCYLMAYKPKEGATALGLMVLGWPLYIVLELVLQLAFSFGSVAKTVHKKVKGSASAPAEEAKA